MSFRNILWRARQSLYERCGNPRFSRPGLYDLDRKLARYLNFRDGFFVEAGANDGFSQSNTYYLEKLLGWSGILVEGIPSLYERAKKRRPGSRVFNCALVPFEREGEQVEMIYGNLMSLVAGAQASAEEEAQHLKAARQFDSAAGTYKVKVPGRTLQSIFMESGVSKIDFLSLDVEGFEAPVLRGLNFEQFAPTYLCIEARYRADVESVLGATYEVVEELTEMDVLYRRK